MTLTYTCPSCGLHRDAPVIWLIDVPKAEWSERLCFDIGIDHMMHSPKCKAKQFSVMMPIAQPRYRGVVRSVDADVTP